MKVEQKTIAKVLVLTIHACVYIQSYTIKLRSKSVTILTNNCCPNWSRLGKGWAIFLGNLLGKRFAQPNYPVVDFNGHSWVN